MYTYDLQIVCHEINYLKLENIFDLHKQCDGLEWLVFTWKDTAFITQSHPDSTFLNTSSAYIILTNSTWIHQGKALIKET